MIGDFSSGLAKAFSDYVTGERQKARQSEDQQLNEQMQLIKALVDRPDVNPALIGRALTDLTAFQQAKGSKRKSKGGKEGFLGATELPISQLLQGLQDGSTPMMGRTSEAVPAPPVPTEVAGYGPAEFVTHAPQPKDINFDVGGIGVHAPYTGEVALNTPIPIPPAGTPMPKDSKRLVSAARDVQAHKALGPAPRRAAPQQPMLRAPEEMAEEAGNAEAAQYKGRQAGQREADIEALRSLGVPEEQIQAAMVRKIGGATGTSKPIPMQSQNWIDGQGVPFSVMFNPDPNATQKYLDEAGNPLDPRRMLGARRISIGGTVQWQSYTDDFGNVTAVPMDRYNPGMIAGAGPMNLGNMGRTSPEGGVTIVAGPDGAPIPARAPRRGNGLTPMVLDWTRPDGSIGIPDINDPTIPDYAQAYRAPSEGTVGAIAAAKEGLRLLAELEREWDPRFTGIIESRFRTFNENWNPFSDADTEFAAYSRKFMTMRNALLRANAGLTQTVEERRNTDAQIPALTNKDDTFLAAIPVTVQYFSNKIKDRESEVGVAVPRKPQGVPPPPGQQVAPQPTAPQAAPPQVPKAPSFGLPGQGVRLRHKATGDTRWVTNPAMVDFGVRSGQFEIVK